jgi:hypothetical protein
LSLVSIAPILLPCTKTLTPESNLSDFPSNTLILVKARGDFGASGMLAEADPGQKAAAAAAAEALRKKDRRENSFPTSVFSRAKAGL